MVRVIDAKTSTESWIPLFDDNGVPMYPELMAELDAIKRDRIGGLMLCRDWGERVPWPTWPKPDDPDFTHMSRKVKEIIRAAGMRDELSFTSFRHGGFTEGGDAELTDREMLAQGRHTTVKVLPKYVKRTTNQIVSGTRCEPKTDRCPNERQPSCPNGKLMTRQVPENIGAGEALRFEISARFFLAGSSA